MAFRVRKSFPLFCKSCKSLVSRADGIGTFKSRDIKTKHMCRSLKASESSELLLAARAALLSLHSAVSKHNQLTRLRFPRSHLTRKICESALSGTFNDAPFVLNVFAQHAEDAACKICSANDSFDPLDMFKDGVAEEIESSRVWAGEPEFIETAVQVFPKTVTMLQEHLLDEVKNATRRFFASIYSIPHVQARCLEKSELQFWERFDRAEAVIGRTPKDHSAAVNVGCALASLVPIVICRNILLYTASPSAIFAFDKHLQRKRW